jgi:hypothetical protein
MAYWGGMYCTSMGFFVIVDPKEKTKLNTTLSNKETTPYTK